MGQVVVCLRSIFQVCEDFLGLYEVDSTEAEKIFAVVKDVLLRPNVAISKVRGQCYDGTSAMTGTRSGVVKKMCDTYTVMVTL